MQKKAKICRLFTDNQSVIKALHATRITSQLVCDCALDKVGGHSKVTLAWVPGHEGLEGNGKANVLAEEEASKPFIEPIPSCGTATRKVVETIAKW